MRSARCDPLFSRVGSRKELDKSVDAAREVPSVGRVLRWRAEIGESRSDLGGASLAFGQWRRSRRSATFTVLADKNSSPLHPLSIHLNPTPEHPWTILPELTCIRIDFSVSTDLSNSSSFLEPSAPIILGTSHPHPYRLRLLYRTNTLRLKFEDGTRSLRKQIHNPLQMMPLR